MAIFGGMACLEHPLRYASTQVGGFRRDLGEDGLELPLKTKGYQEVGIGGVQIFRLGVHRAAPINLRMLLWKLWLVCAKIITGRKEIVSSVSRDQTIAVMQSGKLNHSGLTGCSQTCGGNQGSIEEDSRVVFSQCAA